MNIILGERQTGKTLDLLTRVRDYLRAYPDNKACVISPTKKMSNNIKTDYMDIYENEFLDRIDFISIFEYKIPSRYKNGRIFIDELERTLMSLLGSHIDTVTMYSEKGGLYKNGGREIYKIFN